MELSKENILNKKQVDSEIQQVKDNDDTMRNFRTLISLNILSALDTMDFGLPAAFFPYIADKRGLDSVIISIIFAAFPLFYFLGNSYIAKRLTNFERKKTLFLVVWIGSVFKLMFGFLDYIDDKTFFVFLAILCRIIVGLTSAINLSILLSLISEIWPEDKIRKLALFDTINTMGFAAGPWLGAFCYFIGGYVCVFAVSAFLTLLFGLYIVFYVMTRPFRIIEKTLSFFKGFFHIKVIMNCLLTTFLYGSFCFIASAFENHMIFDLGQDPMYSSMIYGLHLVGCVCALILINNFYDEKYRKHTMFVGGLLNIICEFFLGPETLLGIIGNTNQIVTIGIAMLCLGTANGMTIILIMQDFHDAYEEIFPNEEELSKNMANGMYLASFGSGEFFGILLGGVMIKYFGYARANSIYGIFILGFFIIYWIWVAYDNKYKILNEEIEP